MKSTLLLFVFVLLEVSCAGRADYYWREYYGHVHHDAVPVGEINSNNQPGHGYIGQAFVKDYGLIPGNLQGGNGEIKVAANGVHTTSLYVKMLCSGHKQNFQWLPVQASTLHAQTANKTLVPGGFEKNEALYIGRIASGGIFKIGKVNYFGNPGYVRIWYVATDVESYDKFDILTYEEK